jgi:hypothetical protein
VFDHSFLKKYTSMKKIVLAFIVLSAQMLCAQNVGIGTLIPQDRLSVQTGSNNYGMTHTDGTVVVGTYVGNGVGWFGTKTNHPLAFFTANGSAAMIIGTNGRVGIGTGIPTNFLEIGSVLSGYSGNHIAFGNGTQTSGFTILPNGNSIWQSSLQLSLMPAGGSGSGYLGINTTAPANHLQIGSIGNAGYAGNDIAFGNGSQATAITQTSTASQWYATTDIALMPRGNGHGRVGINVATPGYPLDIEDDVQTSAIDYAYFGTPDGLDPNTSFCEICKADVTIFAGGNVMAAEFDATSDLRIKNIKAVSNTGHDLQILQSLQVMDYTLKDTIKNGHRPFKKVIAQQVESVYPQVVTKHTGFIPNVYRAITSLTKTNKGYLLHFDSAHHLSPAAKKIKLLVQGEATMNPYTVLSVPSATDVEIAAAPFSSDRLFVYGEEVNDFRTVDYEGLATLNISATQELSKQLVQQQALNKEQNEKIAALTAKLDRLLAGGDKHQQP